MPTTTSQPPYRALREATGLSQREIERRIGWFDTRRGRLSIIERGVRPTDDEHRQLMAVLLAAMPLDPTLERAMDGDR